MRVRGFDLDGEPVIWLCAVSIIVVLLQRPLNPLCGGSGKRLRFGAQQALGKTTMPINKIVSHAVIACAGAFAGYLISVGQFGVPSTYAQAPGTAAAMKTTELFNQVMQDVLGRRLTVRLTEREPGNGSPAHRHPGSHTVGYIL